MRYAGNLGVQPDLAVLAQGEAQFVAVVEELEQRLQQVIAVGAAAEDMQHQVELGRRGQDQFGVIGDGWSRHGLFDAVAVVVTSLPFTGEGKGERE